MCKVIKVLDKEVISRRLEATKNQDSAVGARFLRVWARRSGIRQAHKFSIEQLADMYALGIKS